MKSLMKFSVKCLIVDDLEENLFALSALLKEPGVEVLTARSGAEALELLLIHDFALAFLDVQMPDMDGFELAELMRGSERTRHVPIIFVTAGARDQVRFFKGYEIGAVDFLYKPIEPRVLQNKAQMFFQLHRQKQQLAAELEQRTEMLRFSEMFTAVLGHDLRNPLHAIITSSHVLQRAAGESQLVKDTASRIMSSGKRMSRMITDMLDLARARLGGGIPINRERVNMLELIQRVVEEHRAADASCRIEIKQEGNFEGDWDADRLSQVASNLIGNALKHGDRAEPVQVQLDGSRAELVVMRVINAGAIPSQILPHIFDPFRGSQRELSSNNGLGLGLYIVRQLIQAHQGAVDVHSSGEENKTMFRVIVPRSAVR